MIRKSCFLLSLFFSLIACEHDSIKPKAEFQLNQQSANSKPDCDTSKVYFEDDILPLLVSNCAFSGCHDAGTARNGIILTSYTNILNTGGVTPNDLDDSDLYERITETDVSKRMPKNRPPLSAQQIQDIRTWILDGAPNNACENKHCDTTNVTFSMDIQPIINRSCVGCHRSGSLGGGVALDSYNAISSEALSLRLLNVVNHSPGFKAMPLGGEQLPTCEIDKIRAWTRDGAPNN